MRYTLPAATLCALAFALPGRSAEPVDYSRDVKPLLADRCYACHGPDEGRRKAKLRLDVRAEAVKKAVKPGDAAHSPLVERVGSTDPDEVMPPPAAKKEPLTPAQIDLLRRWIDQGAKFDVHWAYVKPVRPPVPAVSNPAWVRNPIDAFVAAGHERQKLQPAPEADRTTLIRRLSFDLTGLPPSYAEVEAFLKDDSADAYEKVVDRLLASPHYGERMAMYWLDLVRYADTNGYHGDTHRDVSLYRDYVIDAFNTNRRFDRFTVEQLAGDLLPNPTARMLVASGYNRLLMTTEEGGAQPKEYTAKYAADRVRNVSSVWLAGTVGCAECHDHKFDPYTTRDFYSLAAFFADVRETAVGKQDQTPVPTPEQAEQLKKLDARVTELRATLAKQTPELDTAQAEWEKRAKADLAEGKPGWVAVRPTKVVSRDGATLTTQDDLSVLSSGLNPDKDVYEVTLPAGSKRITGIRLEALTHKSLTNRSLSRANGNFVLTGFEVSVTRPGDPAPKRVKIASAAADYAAKDFPIEHTLDDDPATGWAVDGHVKAADRAAVFVFAEPLAGGEGTTLTVRLKHESPYAGHNIGRFRLALTSADKPSLSDKALPENVAGALKVEPERRTAVQWSALAAYYREIAPELNPVREQIVRLETERAQLLSKAPTTLVTTAAPPRTMRILPRGNWLDDSGEVVGPATPAFLPGPDAKGRRLTRLDLARWLTSPDNPLVARVFVNRLWKLTFGQGLVKSLEDFGTQGALPTHPELLDWLAVEFVESGWDVKHLLRLMVTSAAYRQSSRAANELRERDPANRWLARQNRFRLDAEMVRDNALAVSGLLVDKVGGPSVKPYQPPGYWSYLNFPKREWQNDKGEGLYRRGLYTYWCRTFLHPSLLAFDAPTREECTVERPRSSTPLQALVLLNDPTYVEASRGFAERIVKEGGADIADRIGWAYRQALSRAATPEEVRVLSNLYHKHRREYDADRDAARKLLSTGDRPSPTDLDAAELAAWTSVARVLFNLHETITRY